MQNSLSRKKNSGIVIVMISLTIFKNVVGMSRSHKLIILTSSTTNKIGLFIHCFSFFNLFHTLIGTAIHIYIMTNVCYDTLKILIKK